MIDARDITGVILCGGAGERMGGADKPLVLLDGEPLVARVRGRLVPQVGRVVISCNRNEARYAAWGDAVVVDSTPGAGPLAGIAAALARVETPFVFVCPGDAPLLSTRLVARLAAALESAGADVAVAHDGERLQPLFLLLRTRIAPSVDVRRAGVDRSVHGFVASTPHVVVDVADERASFSNVNTPQDLATLGGQFDA